MGQRKQRVVFTGRITVEIEAAWLPDDTIEKVMKQASEKAHLLLADMDKPSGLLFRGLELYSVNLMEADEGASDV